MLTNFHHSFTAVNEEAKGK